MVSIWFFHGSTRDNKSCPTANDLVIKMEAVHQKAVSGDKASLVKIHEAFGDYADISGVGENIQKLKDGKFKMQQAKNANFGGQGYYDPNTGFVELGSAFYTSSPEMQAGTILHEASHSILGTADIFDKNGKPTSRAKPTEPGDKVGCTFSCFLRRATDSHLLPF